MLNQELLRFRGFRDRLHDLQQFLDAPLFRKQDLLYSVVKLFVVLEQREDPLVSLFGLLFRLERLFKHDAIVGRMLDGLRVSFRHRNPVEPR